MQRVSGVKGLHRILENYLRKPKTVDQAVEGLEEDQGHVEGDHDHSQALTLVHAQEKGTSLKPDKSNKSDVDVHSDVSDMPTLVGDQGSIWDVQDVHETQAGELDADVDEPDLEQPVLLEGLSWADEESVATQSEGTEVSTETDMDTSESGNETWSMVVGRKE